MDVRVTHFTVKIMGRGKNAREGELPLLRAAFASGAAGSVRKSQVLMI